MRRRTLRSWRGWTVVLLLLAVVSVAAGLPYLVASDDAQRPPLDPQPSTLALPAGRSLESLTRVEVDEVLDGDTIDVLLDGIKTRVRYFGIDTPERGAQCYREAKDRNEQLIGDMVLLLEDVRNEDEGGRLLRYVFLPDGTSVDATLVAEGFAEAWRRDGRYRDQIIQLEAEAQAAGRGCLWKDGSAD